MKRFQIAFWVALACSMANGASAQTPCFAFLLRGDVATVCEGKQDQITRRGDIDDFAVSDKQSSLAFVTSVVTLRTAAEADVVSTTSLIDLRSGRLTRVTGENALVSTCGGIFWLYDEKREHFGGYDLTTGEEVRMPPYAWFRCSADRKVVVGSAKKSGMDLVENDAARTRVAVDGAFNFFQFNVSPDGSKAVYTRDDRPLCVFALPGPAECTAGTDDSFGGLGVPSVNNAGEVLMTTLTSEICFYKSASNFSRERTPGARQEPCAGIGFWKPGLKSVEIVEPIGGNPQWITPDTTKLLRDWGNRGHL